MTLFHCNGHRAVRADGIREAAKVFAAREARRADRILVEAKASGQSLLQDLRLAKVPAIGYNPGNATMRDPFANSISVFPNTTVRIPAARMNGLAFRTSSFDCLSAGATTRTSEPGTAEH